MAVWFALLNRPQRNVSRKDMWDVQHGIVNEGMCYFACHWNGNVDILMAASLAALKDVIQWYGNTIGTFFHYTVRVLLYQYQPDYFATVKDYTVLSKVIFPGFSGYTYFAYKWRNVSFDLNLPSIFFHTPNIWLLSHIAQTQYQIFLLLSLLVSMPEYSGPRKK